MLCTQLRVWPSKSAEEQQLLVSNEESIVYSQAIHYANRMVCLRVPLDATKKIREPATGMEGESLSSMITNRSMTTYRLVLSYLVLYTLS